ncbi:MAG: HAMP domain-containing histidine kinase [Bdellovibrionales bacterium]|nr:HAMP domain-containing histidine kinase [Bdellovibrionales bacterium]
MSSIEVPITSRILNQAQEAAGLFVFPSKNGVSEKAKLLWLVKLRWVAITLILILCGPALVFGALTRETAPWYLAILGVLILFNLLSQLVIAESKRPIGPVIICYQLAFDLLILAGLLSATGGFANPFVILFLLNASLGGVLIPGRLSWPFLVLTHVLIGMLQFQVVLASQGVVTSPLIATFIVFHLMAFSFWLVMRSLGSYLERQSEQQRQAQITLERQDRLRSIGALAAGFSHEFASPLNVAKIRLERLKRHLGASEDTDEALNAILVCQNIIHRMNDSQMDSRDFHFKNVVVGDLLKDIVDSWSEDKEIKPRLDIEHLITASIPPVNFSQVVINLLDNAFDANPSGQIRIELKKVGHETCLSVADDGPGFPASVLRQKGEPFVTTKKNGTGLGLYVSELFAQSLGGHLETRNRPEGGATVRMSWLLREDAP